MASTPSTDSAQAQTASLIAQLKQQSEKSATLSQRIKQIDEAVATRTLNPDQKTQLATARSSAEVALEEAKKEEKRLQTELTELVQKKGLVAPGSQAPPLRPAAAPAPVSTPQPSTTQPPRPNNVPTPQQQQQNLARPTPPTQPQPLRPMATPQASASSLPRPSPQQPTQSLPPRPPNAPPRPPINTRPKTGFGIRWEDEERRREEQRNQESLRKGDRYGQPGGPLVDSDNLKELVEEIAGEEGWQLSAEGVQFLQSYSDEWLKTLTTSAVQLALHRHSDRLEIRDLAFVLNKDWNIKVPGFETAQIKNVGPKRLNLPPGYQSKVQSISGKPIPNE